MPSLCEVSKTVNATLESAGKSLPPRVPSPSTPLLFTAESETDLTSASQDPSAFGDESKVWTAENSEALYGVKGWGSPYFRINSLGHLCVHPQGGKDDGLKLAILQNGS